MQFPYGQCRAASHIPVRCLGLVITPLESAFFRLVIWRPCRAAGIRLQESCDLFFGKIGTFDVGIRFRNAPALCENYPVKISILMVKDDDCSIITQVSLDYCAI